MPLFLGTLGIPAIDYYLVPEHLWTGASCALMKVPETSAELDAVDSEGTFCSPFIIYIVYAYM